MTAPRAELCRFVDAVFPGSRMVELAGDASTRRFYRVTDSRGTHRVIMDYGRSFEAETDDTRLHRIFRHAGLPVPELLEVSATAGCLVLEDLGDRLLESVLADVSPDERKGHLEAAVRLAARVADHGTPVLAASDRADGPALDAERFRFEMEFFLEHYAGALRGLHELPAQLSTALHGLADRAAESPVRVLCHRDYHSRNLMVRDDGRLTMIDIQDARWGPDSYDLASLLRDAYLEIDDDEVDPWIDVYLDERTDPPPAKLFRERFDTVAAQRMIKALGTFGYQAGVLGRSRYLEPIPRTLGRLDRMLPRVARTKPLHALLAESGLLARPNA